MTKPSGPLEARLHLSDEECAAVDAMLAARGDAAPPEVAWRDPGPDPFGMNWAWLEESGSPTTARTADSSDGRSILPFRARSGWKQPASRVVGLAASVLVVALGTWAVLRGGGGALSERDITAWVSRKVEAGGGGLRIAAPADEGDRSDEPLINNIDRPRDAERPASPNVYAPLRVQDQLVIPDVPPDVTPQSTSGRPPRTVAETVRPGSLFYLEFATASTPTTGTAVVVRTAPGPWRALWEEVAVSPADGTCYFGPLKMGEGEAEYLVVLADRTGTPLLSTVADAIKNGPQPTATLDTFRARLASALKGAGHGWWGMQRIAVRPAPGDKPR